MTHRPTSHEIDNAAAAWLARVDQGSLDETERMAFDAWMAASPLHRGAYAKARAVFSIVGEADLNEIDGQTPHVYPASDVRPSPQVSRRGALFLGGGAVAAAVAAGVTFAITSDIPFTSYQTKRGEVRLLPLEDGTIVTLNTESEIETRFNRTVRDVRLLRGEVLFDVAKDTKRPFVVASGNTIVRAVGTSFVVRGLKDQPIHVLVREGAVDMFSHQREDQPIRVPANAHAVALEVPFPAVKIIKTALDPAEVARQLAWRQGMIALEGESLAYAVAEFNRYTDTPIVIEDPKVAALTVAGMFSIYNPAGFAHSVSDILNLQVEIRPEGILLWQ